MRITRKELTALSTNTLKRLSKIMDVPYTEDVKEMVKQLYRRYKSYEQFSSFILIRQLGREGKDGKTFLSLNEQYREIAVKQFKPDKKSSSIVREAKLQMRASEHGLSPRVFAYDGEEKYISMEKLDTNLYDCFCKQGGELTVSQQKEVVKLFRQLDECGIFHGDPNPLNFMKKKGQWYIIDFGFAKPINERVRFRYGQTPNLKYMTLGFLIQLTSIRPDTKLQYIRKIVKETCH